MTAIQTTEAVDSGPGPVTQEPDPPSAGGPHASRRSPRLVARLLPAVLTGLALWFVLFAFVLSGLQERSTQVRLYDKLRLQLAQETAPLAEPVRSGAPLALLNFPAAGIRNVVVVEGTTSRLLAQGPGHLSASPLPGQVGDSILLGRAVTYGGPFGGITGARVGSLLTVTDGQGVFQYRVEDIRRPGSRLPAPLHGQQSRLTLVSAASTGWESGWAPGHTVYLDASLVKGRPQPVPAGLPSGVGQSSLPMHADPQGIVAFLFWFEALIVAGAACSWAWLRWGRLETWLVGAPVLAFFLWGTSGALMRFLPNLL